MKKNKIKALCDNLSDDAPLLIANLFRGAYTVQNYEPKKLFFVPSANRVFITREQAEDFIRHKYPNSKRTITETVCLILKR